MSHLFNHKLFDSKLSKVIALGFVLALTVSTVALIKASNNYPSVSIHFINDNNEDCHQVVPGSTQTLTWTAQVDNSGPGGINVVKAAFHNPISGCASTGEDENLDQSIFSMSGKTHYAEGESGQVSFVYDTSVKNCGRVQVDAGYTPDTGPYNATVFLGEMIDYGVDCSDTPPPITPPPVNNPPVGNLDAVTCDIIGGWVFDPDSSSTSLVVEIFANGPEGIGSLIFSGPTTGLRSDVNAQYGITGNHGYTINYPANLKTGATHEIWVYAKDTTTNQNTLFTNRIIFDSAPCVTTTPTPPTGYFDAGNCTYIGGWAMDADTPNTPVTIEVYMDGPIGTGTLVATTLANLPRADVGNKAFHIDTPAVFKDGNSHTAYVYAVDTENSSSKVLLPGSPITINCVTVVLPGTLSLTKQVRNVSQSQTTFVDSTYANFGEQVEFKMVVTVSGGPLTNVIFTDALPSRLSYINNSLTVDGAPAGNNLSNTNLGSFTAGQSKQVIIRATVANTSEFSTGLTTLTNVANVTSGATTATADADVLVNKDPVIIIPGQPSLSITKQVRNITTNNSFSSSTTASNNDTVQFRIVVQSIGSATANDVRVTDFLPSNLSYISGTFQIDGTSSGNIFSGGQFLGNMSPGQSRTMTFNTQVINASSGQVITNNVQASSSNTATVNATANVIVSQVLGGNINLVLSKKAFNVTRNVDATTVVAQSGDIIRYTLTVQNTGNATATNYVFQDNIADVLQLSQLQDFPGASFDLLYNLVWPSMSIPANSTVEKTFTVKVNSTHPAGTDNIMTNTFGNTVNVQVNKGVVAGAYVAPKTGAGMNAVIALTIITMLGFVGYRQRESIISYVKAV